MRVNLTELLLFYKQICKIGGIAQEHQNAVKPCQLLIAENTQPQNDAGSHSYKAVDQEACLNYDRDDQR